MKPRSIFWHMTFELIVKKVIQACFFLEENIAKIRSVFSLKDLEKYLGFCRLPSWLLKLKCSLTESLLCLYSSWCQKLLLHCGPGQVATRDGFSTVVPHWVLNLFPNSLNPFKALHWPTPLHSSVIVSPGQSRVTCFVLPTKAFWLSWDLV